ADARGAVKVWDVRGTDGPAPERDRGLFTRFSKDGSRQVVATVFRGYGASETDPSDIQVRDAAGKDLLVFRGHKSPLVRIEIRADGRHVISVADFGRDVQVWDTATGRVLLSLSREGGRRQMAIPAGFGSEVSEAGAAFSPDGRRLAAALPEGGVKVW